LYWKVGQAFIRGPESGEHCKWAGKWGLGQVFNSDEHKNKQTKQNKKVI